MSDVQCVNCGAKISSEYCSECGQPARPKKLTWRTAWEDSIDRLLNLDTKLLRTLYDLTIRPGQVARSFIAGNRIKYIPPVSYFIITITITILILELMGLSFADTIEGAQGELLQGEETTDSQVAIQEYMNQLMSKYLKTFSFIQIPFIALACKIFFRRDQFTFIEHAVLALYTHGHLSLLTIVNGISTKAEITIPFVLLFFLPILYFAFAAQQMYSGKRLGLFIKGVLAHLLSTIFFTLFIAVVVGLGLVLYVKFVNPDFLDTLVN